jgi:hypothetical protein
VLAIVIKNAVEKKKAKQDETSNNEDESTDSHTENEPTDDTAVEVHNEETVVDEENAIAENQDLPMTQSTEPQDTETTEKGGDE